MASERLQKIIAASGIASRRKAEEIIAAGRVTLNGKVVVEQGTKADPQRDEICVDGKPLKSRERLLYLDRKSTRLNSSHDQISYAVFCLKKKKRKKQGGRLHI